MLVSSLKKIIKKKTLNTGINKFIQTTIGRLDEKMHNLVYKDDKYKSYSQAMERYGTYSKNGYKESKIGWFNNIKSIFNIYGKPRRQSNIVKSYTYSDKYQKAINDINNFPFNGENIAYINELIDSFKLIDNPSIELQKKYNKIIEYRNKLISKDSIHFERNIKEISDKIKGVNINTDNDIDVETKLRNISSKIQGNSIKIDNNVNVDKKIQDISRVLSIKNEKKPVDIPVDINNYATMDYFGAIRYEKNNDSHMKFSKAISIIRDKSLHQEDEWKEAIGVLSSTFGNGKAKESNIEKKLNDFNKTEKLLSSYGRKIKNNTATNEEKLIYNALLYHLANCDLDSFSIDEVEDYINDYIIEEADRYIEDVKKYQKKI